MIKIGIGQTGDDVIMNCYTVVIEMGGVVITESVRNPLKYIQEVLGEVI